MDRIYFEEEKYIAALKDKVKSEHVSSNELTEVVNRYEDLLYQLKVSNDIAQKLQERLLKANHGLKEMKKVTV